MNIHDQENREAIKITNRTSTPGVVVVLPMTRVTEKSIGNWERILHIADSSNLLALVLIDKTPRKEATSYFIKAKLPKTTQVYILQRDISEDLYDSLLSIEVEGNIWISQLHDDDYWSGDMQLPIDAKQNDLFPVRFTTRLKSKLIELDWDNSPPARINFTLVPSKTWKKFSEFASKHGGHLAASTDYTLDFIARLTCDKRDTLDFEYVYDVRNWKQKRIRTSQLTSLSRSDGWDNLSGTDIQLLNRNLDTLACLFFFKDFIPPDSFHSEVTKLQRSLKLSFRRMAYLHTRLSILLLATPFCELIGKVLPLNNLLKQLEGQIIATRLVTRVSKAESLGEVKSEIFKTKELVFLPRLENRFEFWIKNLGIDT